jgi:hypothetical protein
MSTYRVADGHDVALISLNVLSPQPRSEGIKPTRRTFGGDGTPYDESKYVELLYSMVGTVTEYQAILTSFGVKTAGSNEVTVYVRDETFAWTRQNGLAIRPEPGQDVRWTNYFPRDVVILVRDLSDAA